MAREEYHSAIRRLGSSTPAVSSGGTSALIPEEEYLIDDWLEDDVGTVQPKKRRRVGSEQNGMRSEGGPSMTGLAPRAPTRHAANSAAASRGGCYSLRMAAKRRQMPGICGAV